ncbi:MAG: acyl-CoA dehydrogenase family protein [Deltaproteobacteria bacterium]|nr:acyl-CoA dehydrogenase family protein [Deltaproteobacteria bacterium]
MNQSPPLINYNLFSSDQTLQESTERESAAWAKESLLEFGKVLGSEEKIQQGFQANDYPPLLKTHDRYGNRIDQIEFHPAWHEFMSLSVKFGLHGNPWKDPKPGAHVARAAMMILATQTEYGHLCPISMTYSVIPALRKEPNLAKVWEKKILSNDYDPRFLPASEKKGLIFGMAMTEKQGGSDVRANTTRATPIGNTGEYLITGHKWFCSAPQSDGFLMLAQAPQGLTCFLVPRFKPDGSRNPFFIQRLKNKMANKSNASSEIELDQTWAHRVSEEGRGVATIVEMVNHTRLDCVLGSTGLMRQALAQAIHHTQHRKAFGALLKDHPLMKNVLADLSLESEAATLLAIRLAGAFDRSEDTAFEAPFRRIATALSKYWICKRTPSMIYEALECFGGNGFIEESMMPRLYREAPLNSVWEGSGNVISLDVVRAALREPESLKALLDEIERATGKNSSFDSYFSALKKEGMNLFTEESLIRRNIERLALALQASLMLRYSIPEMSEAFCRSRLQGDWHHCFGTLPSQIDFDAIIQRAQPKL